MWTCPECGRIFKRAKQPHSCKKIPLEKHFENKEEAKQLFDQLVKEINKKVGKVKVISIPCCVHLFGEFDFLAALPKKNSLEIRIVLDRELKSPRMKQGVQMSSKRYKNCFDICSKKEIDGELLGWIKESYYLNS